MDGRDPLDGTFGGDADAAADAAPPAVPAPGGAPAAVRHDVLAGVQALVAAAGFLREAAERAWSLDDTELLDAADAVCRASAVVETARLAMLRIVDDRPGIVPHSSDPAVSFLVHRLHHDPRAAAADVRAARALTGPAATLPAVGAALAAGEITRAHADVAVRTVARMPARLFTTPVPDDEGSLPGDPGDSDDSDAAGAGRPVRTGLQVADTWLAEQARTFPVASTQRLADALVAVLDPDHAARYDEDAHLRRTLVLVREHSTGMGLLRGALTPADTAMLDVYLSHAARPTPGVPAESQDDDTGVVTSTLIRDTRTTGMRRYDALMALVRAGLAGRPLAGVLTGDGPSAAVVAEPVPDGTPQPGRTARATQGDPGLGPSPGPAVHLLVTATVEQVAAAGRAARRAAARATGTGADADPGEDATTATQDAGPGAESFGRAAGLATLHRHGPVHPGLLGYLTCAPTLQRVLLSPDGTPLDLGRTHRLATPAQRRALAARDGGCTTPGCTVPHEGTDAHHQVPWSAGGGTDLDNLLSLCPRHHQELHAGLWDARIERGHVWMRPPTWIDPHRRWTRNTFHTTHRHAHQLAQQLRLALDPGSDGSARPPPA